MEQRERAKPEKKSKKSKTSALPDKGKDKPKNFAELRSHRSHRKGRLRSK